ncbi:MAG: CPBP family intramembrane glutamic endopeptidase [Chloroflexota bacterium]
MSTQDRNSKARDWKWLMFGLAVWVVTVPFLSGVMESPAIALGVTLVWLLSPLLYAFAARDKEGIGLTRTNAGRAVAEMLLVTAIYSLIRVGLIVFVPASVDYVAASAIQVAELLREGQFGSLIGPPALLFPLMFLLTFLAASGNELFYRGFLFTRIRRHTHWLVALLASAALFGFYHYFNSGLSGLIMGGVVSLVSGWLMQRHNNVVAPVLFHYLQYIAAILVFYFVVL